ncbi:hypothetical protein B0J13DRAFT_248831 [Dactylonectria estremocensis]|uniref:Uncharacterized protein n=1 Tax=Dactylonectria estremocensis TaxID=1079267 RepID=A0A9P9F2T8_9HYPO|nr:hypothetical protein B0J13DRAFT_248831 [Dactylonectria estremocensis]
MGKFSFTGRKKQPPQVTVTAPITSKAQKILGASALNIDDDFSGSKVSLAATERSTAVNHSMSMFGSPKHVKPDREWGDESEVLPRHLRGTGIPEDEDYDEYDDLASDMVSVLRKRQSSSTLVSWYDKSKQPLSISQQTSNSAMAKGLPPNSKAHKMLDMGNTSNIKSKKKPAKLDFSHLISRKSKKTNPPPWQGGPMLSTDQFVNSPSPMSPLSSPSIRGKLNKRPTKESLRSSPSEPVRPATTEANRRGNNHLDSLPNLYEHYEQMSFHQIINKELNHRGGESEESQRLPEKQPEPQPEKVHRLSQSKSASNLHLSYHDEQVVSQYARRILPQTPQTPHTQTSLSKTDSSSPIDCAASVSSRHTRTSKASKRTDHSFQESDLLEKSVLSLSSDSEDDMYLESSFKGPASVPDYPTSDISSTFDHRPATSRTSASADNKDNRYSKSSKRSSNAPSSNFLTIPSGNHVKPPVISARSSSLSGSSSNTIQEGTAPRCPSQLSCISNSSSVNTMMTWQSKTGFGLQQARAITMQAAQGPDEDDADSESEKEPESIQRKAKTSHFDVDVEPSPPRAMLPRESMPHTGDQPTPPLSPSSVDFYISSARSSVDGPSGHNRIMAVTRQEEMLLAALRHKRQVMRESILSELGDNARNAESRMPKGHYSKPSEATITESNFDFDFPAPPMCKDKTTVAANGTTVIDLRASASQTRLQPVSMADFPPPAGPALPSSKKAVLKAQKELSRSDHQERILLYLDHPTRGDNGIVEEAEPSPDLSDFMEFETEEFDAAAESEDSNDVVSQVILYPTQSSHSSSRSGRSAYSKRRSNAVNRKQVPELSPDRANELDVPRPDSPISPSPISMPRRGTVNKKTARLSAVGPAQWGYED